MTKRSLLLAAKAAVVVTSIFQVLQATYVSGLEEEPVCADGTVGSCQASKSANTPATSFEEGEHLEQCGLWLAPSALPGSGLGMYAGKRFAKGDPMQQSGDVVIPIVDIMMHQKGRGKFVFLWDEYTWNGKSLGMGHEVMKECNAASPGFGSAANSFLDLVNVREDDPRHSIPSGLHRSKDPGVGAFSTYHDRKSVAKVAIQQGQELFVNYGQHWFEQRLRLGPIPIRGGLAKSTKFYRRFKEVRDNHSDVNSEIYDELWDTFVKQSEWKNESRIMGAFMNTKFERDLLDQNSTLKSIRIKEGLRSMEWLKEFGYCCDHITEGVSTIRQAGRGAFTTRALPKGSVVASLPMIQIVDKTVLEMYELADIKTKKRENRRIAGYQLITNYCYGHQNSTMVLCPYSPIVNLVNHNQTRANVRLEWSDPKRGNQDHELLKKPIDEFAKARTANLQMNMVALRDIQPNEEVLLDYGDVWEAAWQKHVESWNYTDESYVSAYALSQTESDVRTEFEQLHRPYPGNINIECDTKIWKRIDQEYFRATGIVNITKPDVFEFVTCDVLRSRVVKGTKVYTVVTTHPEKKKKKGEEAPKKKTALERSEKLVDIPRLGIRFTDRPYTTDMFLNQAFRHPIMIPDDLFPTEWMNFSPA